MGDALDEVEAGWLRGAAELVERGGPERQAARTEAVWLEELASEARARKRSLLSAWVDAAESLRSAIHVHETERGPLVEALFPIWKGASLRRHLDQALAAQTELQRRLGSAYVVRRLAELTTQSAVGPALEGLAAAGAAWAAERERPALSGDEADAVRARLLAVAGEGAQLLERVRSVVRAALVQRPELVESVFPRRGRPAGPEPATAEGRAVDVPAAESAAAQPESGASRPDRAAAAQPSTPEPAPSRHKRSASAKRPVVGTSPRRKPKAVPAVPPSTEAARPSRRRLAKDAFKPAPSKAPRAAKAPPAAPAPSLRGSSPRAARRSAAPKPAHAAPEAAPSRRKKSPPAKVPVVRTATAPSPRGTPAAATPIAPAPRAARKAPRRS